MALELVGRVGPAVLGDGVDAPFRQGRLGEIMASVLRPKYAELMERGQIFLGGTAATGVAPGTAIGTTSPFSLHNPYASGKLLVPLVATCGYVSGTLGAGLVHVVMNQGRTTGSLSAGTAITTKCARLGNGTAATGLLYTTATLPEAPTLLRPLFSLTALLASTAVAPYILKEEFEGELGVEPGATMSFEATAAAGSTPLVCYGLAWAEVPLPAY